MRVRYVFLLVFLSQVSCSFLINGYGEREVSSVRTGSVKKYNKIPGHNAFEIRSVEVGEGVILFKLDNVSICRKEIEETLIYKKTYEKIPKGEELGQSPTIPPALIYITYLSAITGGFAGGLTVLNNGGDTSNVMALFSLGLIGLSFMVSDIALTNSTREELFEERQNPTVVDVTCDSTFLKEDLGVFLDIGGEMVDSLGVGGKIVDLEFQGDGIYSIEIKDLSVAYLSDLKGVKVSCIGCSESQEAFSSDNYELYSSLYFGYISEALMMDNANFDYWFEHVYKRNKSKQTNYESKILYEFNKRINSNNEDFFCSKLYKENTYVMTACVPYLRRVAIQKEIDEISRLLVNNLKLQVSVISTEIRKDIDKKNEQIAAKETAKLKDQCNNLLKRNSSVDFTVAEDYYGMQIYLKKRGVKFKKIVVDSKSLIYFDGYFFNIKGEWFFYYNSESLWEISFYVRHKNQKPDLIYKEFASHIKQIEKSNMGIVFNLSDDLRYYFNSKLSQKDILIFSDKVSNLAISEHGDVFVAQGACVELKYKLDYSWDNELSYRFYRNDGKCFPSDDLAALLCKREEVSSVIYVETDF